MRGGGGGLLLPCPVLPEEAAEASSGQTQFRPGLAKREQRLTDIPVLRAFLGAGKLFGSWIQGKPKGNRVD